MVCAFLEKYYYDIFDLERDCDENGYITVSAEGLAYFIKTVFRAVFGRSIIKIVFSSTEKQFEMRFSFKTPADLDKDKLEELKHIASASGMTLLAGALGDDTILQLKAAKRPTQNIVVYANSPDEITAELWYAFFLS